MNNVYFIKNGELYHADISSIKKYKKDKTNKWHGMKTYRINYPDGYYAICNSADGDIYGKYIVYGPTGNKIPQLSTKFAKGSLEKLGIAGELRRNGVAYYPFNLM